MKLDKVEDKLSPVSLADRIFPSPLQSSCVLTAAVSFACKLNSKESFCMSTQQKS